MSSSVLPLPPSYKFGRVVCRVLQGVSDSPLDADHFPEARPATGKITFTPSSSTLKSFGKSPSIVGHGAYEYKLHVETGELVDSSTESVPSVLEDLGDGEFARLVPGAGVWLFEGVWNVKFSLGSVTVPSFPIKIVAADHTVLTPMDLVTEAPFVPQPAEPVAVVELPLGRVKGRVLGISESGEVAWIAPAVDLTTVEQLVASAGSAKDLAVASAQVAQSAEANTIAARDLSAGYAGEASTSASMATAAASTAVQAKADTQALVADAAAITGLTGEDEAVALLLSNPASSTRAALADVVAPSANTQAGQTMATAVEFGTRDVTMTVLGDSTGNDWFEWPTQLATKYGEAHPPLAVKIATWDHAAQAYSALTTIQQGEAVESTLVADNFNRVAADVIGSTPQTGGVWAGTAGRFSVDGAKLVVNAAGLAHAQPGTAPSGAGTVTTNATAGIDCTAGKANVGTLEIGSSATGVASHLFVSLYVPLAGGLQWALWQRISDVATQLAVGEAFTYTGAQTVTAEVKLAGNQATATVNGRTVTATLAAPAATILGGGRGVTLWAKNTAIVGTTVDGITSTVSGAATPQTLTVYNGSHPGSRLEYQTGRIEAMLPAETDLVVVNSCHNYGVDGPAIYIPAVQATVEAVNAQAPAAEIILSGQNPQFMGGTRTPGLITAHASRLAALRAEALSKGLGYWPVFETFRKLPDGGRSWVQADGIHPNYDPAGLVDGSQVWAGVALQYVLSMEMGADPAP